jgi:hypothetical protein
LAPTDDWRVQNVDESCVLTRNFRDPSGEAVQLQLQSFGPSQNFKITMVGEGLPLRDSTRGVARIRYRFNPDPDWREGPGATGYIGGVDMLTFDGNVSTNAEFKREKQAAEADGDGTAWFRYDEARAAEVERLSLAYRAHDDTVLQIGSMSEPLAQIQDCARTLVRQWGYEPAVLEGLRIGPRLLNVQEMGITFLRAMERGHLRQSAPIHFRMDIDESGIASGCVVQHPNRGSAVGALICQALSEAGRFQPALDSSGDPVRAPYVSVTVFGG